jgi:hypothetical protein
MQIVRTMALAVLVGSLGFGIAGCDKSRDEMRPDMDAIHSGDHGPQARDLREMANQMAPDLVACKDIALSPTRVIIVQDHMENRTEDMPGRDMDIYLAKLVGLLNRPVTADKIIFLESRETMAQMQARELGGNANPSAAMQAQYALHGVVRSMANRKTTYYLFTMTLTNLQTRQQVWNKQYEVLSLTDQ